jgi:hypothetical protein
MVTWCIDEIRYKTQQFKETGTITAYNGNIVKSDIVIPLSLQQDLRTAAAPLEDVPDVHRDWHPGSDGTVLDLVHPSLFPVVYGRTRILTDSLVSLEDCVQKCGEGVTLQVPSSEESQLARYGPFERFGRRDLRDPYSRKFQWLPCEVGFKGDHVK